MMVYNNVNLPMKKITYYSHYFLPYAKPMMYCMYVHSVGSVCVNLPLTNISY